MTPVLKLFAFKLNWVFEFPSILCHVATININFWTPVFHFFFNLKRKFDFPFSDNVLIPIFATSMIFTSMPRFTDNPIRILWGSGKKSLMCNLAIVFTAVYLGWTKLIIIDFDWNKALIVSVVYSMWGNAAFTEKIFLSTDFFEINSSYDRWRFCLIKTNKWTWVICLQWIYFWLKNSKLHVIVSANSTLYVRACTFGPVKINHFGKFSLSPLSIKFVLD